MLSSSPFTKQSNKYIKYNVRPWKPKTFVVSQHMGAKVSLGRGSSAPATSLEGNKMNPTTAMPADPNKNSEVFFGSQNQEDRKRNDCVTKFAISLFLSFQEYTCRVFFVGILEHGPAFRADRNPDSLSDLIQKFRNLILRIQLSFTKQSPQQKLKTLPNWDLLFWTGKGCYNNLLSSSSKIIWDLLHLCEEDTFFTPTVLHVPGIISSHVFVQQPVKRLV